MPKTPKRKRRTNATLRPKSVEEICQLFAPLWVDLEDLQILIAEHPRLAHYTSLDVLEKILKNDEIWFANPLFMNDLQEVRFGIHEGARLFRESDAVKKACGTDERAAALRHYFEHYYKEFDEEQAFDTYIFCLSKHDPKRTPDGLLSMWRAYGKNGNGAALVFNTDFVDAPAKDFPLLVARVNYDTNERRILNLEERIKQWCKTLG